MTAKPPPTVDDLTDDEVRAWNDAALAEELLPAGVETLPPYQPPEHRAARKRTDDEQRAIAKRACCVDAAEGPDDDGTLLHTLGCPNRCAVDVPCLAANGGPGTYQCAASIGHNLGHWVPPQARLAMHATGTFSRG
jgi:hypothetical protein